MFSGKDITPALIAEVQKDSPAETYGLKNNDILLNIDENKVESLMDVPKFITLSNDDFIEFIVLRNNDEYTLKVKPNLVESTDDFGNPLEKRMVGIQIGANNNTINHVKLGPTKAAYYSAKEIIFVSQKTISMMWGYIQKLWGKGYGDVRQLGGPIKIAQISGDVAKMGLLPFIIIIAYISISLGLINLFPIPLLDGGHIALNTIEGIRGKEFNKGTIDITFRIGFSIVVTLMVFTTINDIYNSHEKISVYFKALFN
jgi:regulator of sigma E protease